MEEAVQTDIHPQRSFKGLFPFNRKPMSVDQERRTEKPPKQFELDIKDPQNEQPETTVRARLIVKGLNNIIASSAKEYALLEKKSTDLTPEEINQLLSMSQTILDTIEFIRNPYIPTPPTLLLKKPGEQKWQQALMQRMNPFNKPTPIHLDSKTIEAFIGGDIFSTLSHDIQNKVTPLKGNSQLYAHFQQNTAKNPNKIKELRSEVIKSLLRIAIETEHQTTAISQELKNAKFYVPADYFRRAYLQSVVQAFGEKLDKTGSIDIKFSMDPKIPPDAYVEWSTFRTGQILSNIAVNSTNEFIDSEHKNPSFKMAVTTSEDGNSLVIHLDDNGRGYPQAIKEKGIIQASAEKIGGYRNNKVVSHGEGLANHAKVLEEKYGGKLLAEDVKDEHGNVVPGARTTIIIPLKRSPTPTLH